jgi:putative transposase
MKLLNFKRIKTVRKGAASVYLNNYHIVFSTKHRETYLTPILKIRIRNWLRFKSEELGIQIFIMNGYLDHIHLLVSIPTIRSVSSVVKHIKGYTSFLMGKNRYWQKGYYAEALKRDDVERVFQYIRTQYKHHQNP